MEPISCRAPSSETTTLFSKKEVTHPAPPPSKEVVSPVVYEAIVNGAGDVEVILEILPYLKSIGQEIPESFETAIHSAVQRKKFIDKTLSTPNSHLMLSSYLSEEISHLESDEPFIYVGCLQKPSSSLWQKLLPPEALKWFASPNSFYDLLKQEFFKGCSNKDFLQDSKDLKEIVSSGFLEIRKKMKSILPPSCYKAFAKSLKKDRDQLIAEHFSGTMFEKLFQKDLEEHLQTVFQDVFHFIQSNLTGELNKLIKETSSWVPAPIRPVLAGAGLKVTEHNEFYIELKKGELGLYTLKLYGDDQTGSLKFPITFSNINKELLTEEFWEAIVLFSLWSKNQEIEATFSIKDVYKTISDALRIEGTFSESGRNCSSSFEVCKAFVEGIDDSFVEELKKAHSIKDTPCFDEDAKKTLLPPFLADFISQMGPNQLDKKTVKEVLSAILGNRGCSSLDTLLDELPEFSKEKPIPKALPKTFSEIFGFNFISDIKQMRISILHAIRVLSKISDFITSVMSWIFMIHLLSAFLTIFFPGIGFVISLPIEYVAALLLMYGTKVLKELIPERYLEKITHIFEFYSSFKKSIEYQLKLILLKVAAKYLINPSLIDEITKQLEIFTKELTGRGEVSYLVTKKQKPLPLLPSLSDKTTPCPPLLEEEESVLESPVTYSLDRPIITQETLAETIHDWINTSSTIYDSYEKLHYLNTMVRHLPIPTDEEAAFWQEVEDPDKMLDRLKELMCSFFNFELSTRHEKIELVTSLYALYTIIDALARHPKTTYRIPLNFPSNGSTFLLYANAPGARAIKKTTRQQMQKITRFFGGDPYHVYTLDEVEKLKTSSMLFEDYDRIESGIIPDGDRAYLKTLFPEDDLRFEDFIQLFAETSALKPYYLLRSIHILARNTLLTYSYTNSALTEVTFTPHYQEPPKGLLALFHRATFDYFRTTLLTSNRQILRSGHDKYIDVSLLAGQHQIRDNSSFSDLESLFNSQRTQSEIALKSSHILPRLQNVCKKEIFSLLEILDQVRSDQIIRTMSLFLQNPSLLKHRTFAHIFEIFLLHPSAIFEAFKERDELLSEMGERFFVLIQKLLALQEPNSALFVAKIANEFISLCQDFDPDIRLKTRDFRSLVREEFSSPLSKLVLCTMYLNTNPETCTEIERLEVIEAIEDALHAFPERYPSQLSLPPSLEDIVFKTEELAWTFGYRSDGKKVSDRPKKEDRPSEEPLAESSEWRVDLTEDDHDLHLLSWFQPLSEIEVFANRHRVTSLEFKKLKLKFLVKKIDGSYKACSQDPSLKKFFIAKKQKLKRLESYGSYLLLESRDGDKKVCLPLFKNSVLFGERFLHSVKKANSPFVEKLLQMIEPSESCYTYTLKEDGSLDSNDPKAIAYLALFHAAKDDYPSMKKYLLKLARLGKRTSFCKECFTHIESLLILIFLSPTQKDPTLFLKLIAIKEENRLIQQESSKDSNLLSDSQIALFVMAQSKYHLYLEEGKKGLSEIDELFILKYITKNCPIPEALKKFSSSLANLALMPLLKKRYDLLKRKYLDEEASFKTKAENALLKLILGADDEPSTDESKEAFIHPSRIQQFLSIANHPLFDYETMSLKTTATFCTVFPLDSFTPSLCKLTPENIFTFFFYYYTMLYQKEPGISEALSKNLLKIHATFTDPNARLLLYILQTVAKEKDPKTFFPEPFAIRNNRKIEQLIQTCAQINAEASFFSELKKRVTLDGALSLAAKTALAIAKNAVSTALFPAKAALFAGRGIARFVHELQEDEELQDKRLEKATLNEPIDPVILEAILERELEIDALLSLSEEEPTQEEVEEPNFLPLSDLSEASVIREFEKINESLLHFAQRGKKRPIKHVFKGFRQKIERDLLREKEEIEARVGLSFEDIEKRFLDGDDELFPKEILLKIYLYKVSRSRWNAFFKRGSVKRAYKFDELSQKALRVFLTFEEKGETLIWAKQYGPLKKLIESPHTKIVSQMLMGLGKTDTLMPIMDTLDATGEKIVINIRPAPIAPSAIEKSAERNHLLFSRLTSAIPLSRNGWTFERLEALYLKIIQIIRGREEWDGIKEEFQALELRFIEETIDYFGTFEASAKEDWLKRLELFQKILALLRTRGKAHIDEAHISFERKTELSYPIGPSHPLKEEHTEIMEEVLLAFFTTPELSRFMSAYKSAPEKIHRSVYETEILPILAHKLANGDATLAAYFLNKKGLEERNPKFDLMKGALYHLLPTILAELMHVTYARAKEGDLEFAIPSEGNENPQEKSTFKNHFAAWMKTALLLTHDRLNELQLEKFIALLKKQAHLELKDKSKTEARLNQTSAGRYFSEQSGGLPLFGFSEKDRPLIFENLNKSDLVILDYARLIIRKQIRYYEFNISSNSHNFASMFREFSAYTASLHKSGVFPKDTGILEDPGTVGETVSLLQEKDPPCHVLDRSMPEDALREILSKFFVSPSKFRAIIDRGAIFNGVSNQRVAKAILDHIIDYQKQVEGVVFYNEEKKLVIWEKGNLTPIPLSESRLPPENRITYFDQSHTYAADIPQGTKAKAIVTIGEDLIAEDLSQAIWRMRGLKTKEQDFEFLMTAHTKNLIAKDGEVKASAILKFAIRNQALMSEEDNYFSDLAAISNVLRRRVLDKALGSNSVEEMIHIIRSFKDLFVETNSGDPSDFFGGQDLLVSPYEIFEDLRQKLMHLVAKTSIFSPQEQREIFSDLSVIKDQYYPEKVHKRAMISASATQTVSLQQEDFEEELEEQEVELTESCAQQTDVKKEQKGPISHKTWYSFYHLRDLLKEADSCPAFPSSFLTPLTIFSMRQILMSHELGSLRAIAPYIDPRVSATNNLFLDPPNAFDVTQIPPLEALLIEEGGKIQKFILLSKEDAVEWRQKLTSSERGMALFDLNTQLIVKESPDGFDKGALNQRDFQLMLLQIRFLRGDTEYEPFEQDLLFPWLERLPLSAIKDYLTEPHRKADFLSSTLEYFVYTKESAMLGPKSFLRA